MSKPSIFEAIKTLMPDALFYVEDNSWEKIVWVDEREQPSRSDIQVKYTELLVAEPLKELREERNRRIALTDWRFRSDLSPSQEWKDYCVALRDLPANYSPTIDILTEDGYPLVKEDNTTPWPKEPNDG